MEVSTLKDLEIAKMFSNFSTKVKVVMTKNVFTEIDHLMFRDSIKESMEESDFEFIDKASINRSSHRVPMVWLRLRVLMTRCFLSRRNLVKRL